jgi:hypothetical protein
MIRNKRECNKLINNICGKDNKDENKNKKKYVAKTLIRQ